MTKRPRIIRAAVTVALPVECRECRRTESSQSIKVEVKDCDVSALVETLNRCRVGTSFPVGWANFYGQPHDTLVCPECLAKMKSKEAGRA